MEGEFPIPNGWRNLISDLKSDLARIAPEVKEYEVAVSRLGRLQFYYSIDGLSERQQQAVDARVKRAEESAWQTCVVCGRLGTLAYKMPPPMARVFCGQHKPKDWNTLDG